LSRQFDQKYLYSINYIEIFYFSLCDVERNKKINLYKALMKIVEVSIKVSDESYEEFLSYLKSLPVNMILFGLRFAHKRYVAETGGYLFPGRKSIIKKETDMLSKEQAQWRLDNWKKMIANYREKGYSYPTISRIKKKIENILIN
jgi:hypothetical protein